MAKIKIKTDAKIKEVKITEDGGSFKIAGCRLNDGDYEMMASIVTAKAAVQVTITPIQPDFNFEGGD